MSSMDMKGFSITILPLKDHALLPYIDLKVDSPFWTPAVDLSKLTLS